MATGIAVTGGTGRVGRAYREGAATVPGRLGGTRTCRQYLEALR